LEYRAIINFKGIGIIVAVRIRCRAWLRALSALNDDDQQAKRGRDFADGSHQNNLARVMSRASL
jgi:hypothetical protein